MWSSMDNNPPKLFTHAFESFCRIARETKPSEYVGDGWRTCTSKILDNALIGYLKDQFDHISKTRAFKSPTVGVAMVIRRGSQILLLRRAMGHQIGTWSTPGGYLDFGEEPEAGARREAEEESGLIPEEVSYIGFTNDIFEDTGLHHVTLWFHCETTDSAPILSEESSEWGWFSLDDLPSSLFLPFRNLIKNGLLT